MPAIEEFAGAICTTVYRGLEKYGLSEPTLVFEPGRYIVANAGLLLGTVGVIKEWRGAPKWVHVDASTNSLMRVRTSNWYYHIVVANKADLPPVQTVDIVGPLCDAADVLGRGRALPKVEPGDIIAVLDTGAYAESTACQFNLSPRPAGVLVSGEKADVITVRENVNDLLARQRVPPRLLVG